MEILIGTRDGAFVAGGEGPPRPAEGLAGREVITLGRADGSILAGTDRGVYRSSDARSWQASGCEDRAVRAVVAAPGDHEVYAGTQPAALYRSADGGRTWDEVESLRRIPGSEDWGLPGEPNAARALAIAFDAQEPSRCWVGIEVGGIMATADGGETWSAGAAGNNPDIHALAVDPAQRDVVYAATGFGLVKPGADPITAGIYKSADGGASWRYVWPDEERRYTRPMVVDSRAPHALTVASTVNYRSSYRDPDGAHSMLYQSLDQGETWRSLGDEAHSPSAANLTALAQAEEPGSVFVGTDSGEVWRVGAAGEWTQLASGLPHVSALLGL